MVGRRSLPRPAPALGRSSASWSTPTRAWSSTPRRRAVSERRSAGSAWAAAIAAALLALDLAERRARRRCSSAGAGRRSVERAASTTTLRPALAPRRPARGLAARAIAAALPGAPGFYASGRRRLAGRVRHRRGSATAASSSASGSPSARGRRRAPSARWASRRDLRTLLRVAGADQRDG